LKIDVSHNNVVMRLRCEVIFNHLLIANLLLSVKMKEFLTIG